MQDEKKPPVELVYTALIVIQILFGINYIISKIVVEAFPPLLWASIRIVISSVCMLGFALLSRRPHPKCDFSFFGPLIIFALLGTIINQASFLVGLKYTTSTNSAILNTLIPIFTLLIVTLRKQEPVTVRRVLGFISAFAGVLVIRKVEDLSLSNKTLIGDLLTILNCFSYGLFLSYSKNFLTKYDPIWTTTWLFIYGSIGLTLLSIPGWSDFVMPAMNAKLWAAVVFAILGATLMTYFLNFWALAHAKSTHVAIFIYLQPVVASAVGWLWFHEIITLRTVLSSVLIFLGLLISISKDGGLELLTAPIKKVWQYTTNHKN